jgi:amino acid adenylation domain-containing protein
MSSISIEGSYKLNSFTENRNSEVSRLHAQVDLFFEKEFEIYGKFGLKNGMRIIECGSGPGFLLRNILNKLPDCDAMALEIDPFLIEILKENSYADDRVLFDVKQASIYETGLQDNRYDFAIVRLVVEHLNKPADALREMYRILKPGGKLIIVSNDFANHILTYPVIPELDEMYAAYCRSRISEGGHPYIGRQLPLLFRKENFTGIRNEILHVHSEMSGDEAFLKAENVNISKSLVSEGFLSKETLDALAAGWYNMLKDPDHVIYRQLFVCCGEKSHVPGTVKSGGNGHENEKPAANESHPEILKNNESIRKFLLENIRRIMGDKNLTVRSEAKLSEIDIDSIAAAELVNLIKKNFRKQVSITDILQRLSINDLVRIILETPAGRPVRYINGHEPEKLISGEPDTYTNISGIQEQFWILHKLHPQNSAYNIPSLLRITGKIDVPALEYALNKVVNRHEILRSTFVEENSGVWQRVKNDHNLVFIPDIVHLEVPYDLSVIADQVHDEVHRPFNLSEWPLFRIKLFIFSNRTSVLSVVFHHIIIDLQSRLVFGKEISELYNSFCCGKPAQIVQPGKYSDYTSWLAGWLSTEEATIKTNEWKEEIPGSSDSLPLPADFQKPLVENLEGKRIYFDLDAVTSAKIRLFANDNAVNPFTVLLTAYSILLNRICNQSEFTIGVPLTNRRRIEFTETLGCFVNVVPVLFKFMENSTVDDMLSQTRQSLLKVHRRQEVPFMRINKVFREAGRSSVFLAAFTMESPMNLTLNGLTVEPLKIDKEGSQLDLFLTLCENNDNFSGWLEYSTKLFSKRTAERLTEIYRIIAGSLPVNSSMEIADINIVPEKEKGLLLDWNNTGHIYSGDMCLHHKLEQQVRRTPERVALLYGDKSMSYLEFDRHVNRLANHLVASGVKTEDIVCVCLERSPELVIAIHSVHKAGAAYLPVDPVYPEQRIETILVDAQPRLILTNKKSDANLPSGFKKIYLDNILECPLSDNDSAPSTDVKSHNLAYLLYTSGSTGKPKGVMIEHHSVINELEWMQYQHPLGENDTILLKTPVTFDVSVWELFWWVFNGASLAILPHEGEKDPRTIISEIESKKVSVIVFVPSMFTVFLGYLKAGRFGDRLASLKWIIQIGEALSPSVVRAFNDLLTPEFNPLMVNTYGPTEATVAVSRYNCPKEKSIDKIYIGKPIFNTKLVVLNRRNKLQPVGIPGELVITGVNLARGYLNRPELNTKRFISFEYPDGSILRGYRTGDLVKWTDDGNIDFIGRIDNQVKLRGYRIELGDIEAQLNSCPGVKTSAVIVKETDPGHNYLAGYVVLKENARLKPEEIKNLLAEKIPFYMIPSHIIILEEMPLNASGKIDRKALPEPVITSGVKLASPDSFYEKKLVQIFKSALKVENIGITHNFFDMGGNSLLAIRVVNEIREELGFPIEPIHLMEYPDIRRLANYIANDGKYETLISSAPRRQDFSRLQERRRM